MTPVDAGAFEDARKPFESGIAIRKTMTGCRGDVCLPEYMRRDRAGDGDELDLMRHGHFRARQKKADYR